MSKLTVGVVIPTYNEKGTIVTLLEKLNDVLVGTGVEFTILVVDDNSPDGTADAVREYMATNRRVDILVRKGKMGLGSAILDGFITLLENPEFGSKITHVVTMDGDLSHNPDDLPILLSRADDADLVQGSRYVKGGRILGWSIHRKVISWGANSIARLLFGRDVKDYTSNYRVYSRRLALKLIEMKLDKSYDMVVEALVIAKKLGYKVVEAPITFVNRKKGVSKLKFRDIVKWFIHIVKLRRRLVH